MNLNRRRFMQVTGVSLLTAPLAACISEMDDPEAAKRFLRTFFDGLAANEVAKAYDQTSADYKQRRSLEAFSALVRERGLDGPVEQSWTKQSHSFYATFGSSTATTKFTGYLTNKRRERMLATIRIVRHNGKDALDDIEVEPVGGSAI
jgi:hypothetical protein